MRRDLILDDFIMACQAGRMTRKEKDQALWIMRVSSWTLENVTGVPTELRNKMKAASVFLQDEASAVPATIEPVTIIDAKKELDPIATFGLTAASDDDHTHTHNRGEPQ